MGKDIRHYIRDLRIEAAEELLRSTEYKILEIAQATGFSSLSAFSRSFAQANGMRPSDFRAQAKMPAVQKHHVDLLSLRRAINGRLDQHQALELASRLAGCRASPTDRSGMDVDELIAGSETRKAEAVWAALHRLPPAIQRLELRGGGGFSTSALFDLLLKQARLAGRVDRRRGIQATELALESLAMIDRTRFGEERMRQLEALGWARLGTAHCLNHELADSEFALARASSLAIPAEGSRMDTQLGGEILATWANLRWYQRRLVDARTLLESALSLLGEEHTELRASSLTLLGTVTYWLGKPEDGIDSLRLALKIAEANGAQYLALAAAQTLGISLVAIEAWAEAEELLHKAQALQALVGSQETSLHLTWFEGLIRLGQQRFELATELLNTVRAGFADCEDTGKVALATMDLALAATGSGDTKVARRLLQEVLVLLASLSCSTDVQSATLVLDQILRHEALCLLRLRQARRAAEEALTLLPPAAR